MKATDKIINTSTGSAEIDPKMMDSSDLLEAAYMLQASATLLRQSFGIVSMTNTLLDSPLEDRDMKEFANHWDVVHKTMGVFVKGLKDYLDTRKDAN